MVLQLHRKVQKRNLPQRKLTKMLYDYSLFWEGVWMSNMGSQAREAMRTRFGPAPVPSPAPSINMWVMCVCTRHSLDSMYKHSTTFMHTASIPLERVFF